LSTCSRVYPISRSRSATSPCSTGPEVGLRIAALWLLRGTYCGVPTYGPITRTPVNVLGISHFELKDGKILREFRLVDEIAILAQIHAGRVAAKAA
jgi:hypothetical protein